jgi:hypothetical protein
LGIVDFHAVAEKHAAIHLRLENWGAWCHGRGHAQMSPMFRLYRSSDHHEPAAPMLQADAVDAARIAKAVIALPEDHRHALSWCYVNKGAPARACRFIGCGMEHLARLVSDGRQMLLNRKV